MLAVCCVLCDVRCALCVVCCLLCDGWRLLCVVGCLLLVAVNCIVLSMLVCCL